MTQDEIIEMAQQATGMFTELPMMDAWIFDDKSLVAFAKLVAQHEREKFCAVLRQLHDSYSLASDSNAIKAALEAKDEPVDQPQVRTGNCLRVGVCASEGHKIQPQRTWVGLTDEEKHLFSSWLDHKTDDEVFTAIEAKLKEKNT